MKIVKKLVDGKIVYVNAETNEIIDVSITDEVSNLEKTAKEKELETILKETIESMSKQANDQTKKINELVEQNNLAKEANVKAKFLENGGNEHAWETFKNSQKELMNSTNLDADIAKIKQEKGFFFQSSPNHEAKASDSKEEIDRYPDTFYK